MAQNADRTCPVCKSEVATDEPTWVATCQSSRTAYFHEECGTEVRRKASRSDETTRTLRHSEFGPCPFDTGCRKGNKWNYEPGMNKPKKKKNKQPVPAATATAVQHAVPEPAPRPVWNSAADAETLIEYEPSRDASASLGDWFSAALEKGKGKKKRGEAAQQSAQQAELLARVKAEAPKTSAWGQGPPVSLVQEQQRQREAAALAEQQRQQQLAEQQRQQQAAAARPAPTPQPAPVKPSVWGRGPSTAVLSDSRPPAPAPAPAPASPPSTESHEPVDSGIERLDASRVSVLVNMGFTLEQASEMLLQTNNDVEAALEMLLKQVETPLTLRQQQQQQQQPLRSDASPSSSPPVATPPNQNRPFNNAPGSGPNRSPPGSQESPPSSSSTSRVLLEPRGQQSDSGLGGGLGFSAGNNDDEVDLSRFVLGDIMEPPQERSSSVSSSNGGGVQPYSNGQPSSSSFADQMWLSGGGNSNAFNFNNLLNGSAQHTKQGVQSPPQPTQHTSNGFVQPVNGESIESAALIASLEAALAAARKGQYFDVKQRLSDADVMLELLAPSTEGNGLNSGLSSTMLMEGLTGLDGLNITNIAGLNGMNGSMGNMNGLHNGGGGGMQGQGLSNGIGNGINWMH